MTPRHDTADELHDLARRYLRAWGLSSHATLEEGASRVASEVRRALAGADSATHRQAVLELTRAWMEAFLRGAGHPSPRALFRARGILGSLPEVLLDVPLPRVPGAGETDALARQILPPPDPSPLREQEIEGPVAHGALALRDARSLLQALLGGELPSRPVSE